MFSSLVLDLFLWNKHYILKRSFYFGEVSPDYLLISVHLKNFLVILIISCKFSLDSEVNFKKTVKKAFVLKTLIIRDIQLLSILQLMKTICDLFLGFVYNHLFDSNMKGLITVPHNLITNL